MKPRALSLLISAAGTGFVTLLNEEREKAGYLKSLQATAARQVSIALVRKLRCVDAVVRWRWTLKVL